MESLHHPLHIKRYYYTNCKAATQDKFYSTLRGFIIAQLRKTSE